MPVSTCFTNCSNKTPTPTNVDFTIDVSAGAQARNGCSVVKSGVIVARTPTGISSQWLLPAPTKELQYNTGVW
jgi:hypothetical protein